jgi:hypothetical protein
MRTSILGLLLSAGAVLVVACSSVDATDEVSAESKKKSSDDSSETQSDDEGTESSEESPDGGKTKPSADGGASGKCPHEGPLLSVAAFAPCREGGRCVPEGVVPAEERSRLAACVGTGNAKGFCVPEKILANEGNYLPKSCTSLAGGEGRCLSRVFPDIDAQKNELPKDVCEETERCAPCYDPTNGKETGACSSVSCDSPKKPKVVFKDCCITGGKPKGRCVPKSSIPKDDQDGLEKKECDTTSLCAPAEQLDPAYKNPRCKGDAPFLGTYDGVCISNCVKKEWYTELATSQGNCAAGAFCAPCKNPLTGEATGAPNCP